MLHRRCTRRIAVIPSRDATPHRRCWASALALAYHVGIWLLLATLLFAQSFGVVWTSVSAVYDVFYGQPIAHGLYAIPGFNDEPYSDRVVACVRRGQYYRPVQLSQLLAISVNDSGDPIETNGVDGYRVVSRNSFTMDATKFWYYNRQCTTLAATLDAILSACDRLGYNATRDVLRVVDGLDSDRVVPLRDTLPVLINPTWDYNVLGRYIVPGRDGSACVLHISGTFESETDTTTAPLRAVSRAIREAKTEEWLGYPGGVWRNGWYEDPVVHRRWYADVFSTQPHNPYGLDLHQFDLFADAREVDCARSPMGCGGFETQWKWGDLTTAVAVKWYHSVVISNGARFGFFLFDADVTQTTTSHYSLEKLISNATFAVLLARWLVAMVALARANGTTIGLGAMANTQSFYLLPLLLLPRLHSSLQAFWSSGCVFQGDQEALAVAWFEMYPAIGEVVLVYFSLLNSLAKVARRRMSDAGFGPTLLFFALLHWCRTYIALADSLEFDKRVSSVVTVDQAAAASLVDYFTTGLAFRLNGRVYSIFMTKVVVLALNLVPIVWPTSHIVRCGKEWGVEQALARRVASIGGLGAPSTSTSGKRAVSPYDIVRTGYIVVHRHSSRPVLLSIDHYMWMVASAPLQRIVKLTSVRVVVFAITSETHDTASVSGPRIVSLDDQELADLDLWRCSALPFG